MYCTQHINYRPDGMRKEYHKTVYVTSNFNNVLYSHVK